MADEELHSNITMQRSKQSKKENPRRFYSHFLFKAFIGTLFLLLVPIRAPEEDSLFTRSLEIIHLVFVGVAVSYGLFSRKNNEDSWGEATMMEGKLEGSSDQGYVSRLLSVSSVFDGDEGVGNAKGFVDDGGIETWSSQSQYRRNDPVMVEMPLSLPVRRLKSRGDDGNGVGLDDRENSRVDNDDDDDYDGFVNGVGVVCDDGFTSSSVVDEVLREDRNGLRAVDADEFGHVNGDFRGYRSSISRSSSIESTGGSSRESKKSTINGEFGSLDGEEKKKGTEDGIVLPSPIPWRSRSLRMELKEEFKELEPRRSFGSQSSRNFVPHLLGERLEDEDERIRHYIPSPPPPPPLPQYRSVYKSPLFKPRSGLDNGNNTSISVRSEPKDYSQTGRLLMAESANGNEENGNGKMGIRSIETMSKRDTSASRTTSLSDYSRVTRNIVDEVTRKVGYDHGEYIQSEVDDDQHGGKSGRKNETIDAGEDVADDVADESPDVDKKADEFIAKFREQIRLQRIDSIKRSTLRLARDS